MRNLTTLWLTLLMPLVAIADDTGVLEKRKTPDVIGQITWHDDARRETTILLVPKGKAGEAILKAGKEIAAIEAKLHNDKLSNSDRVALQKELEAKAAPQQVSLDIFAKTAKEIGRHDDNKILEKQHADSAFYGGYWGGWGGYYYSGPVGYPYWGYYAAPVYATVAYVAPVFYGYSYAYPYWGGYTYSGYGYGYYGCY